MSPWRSDQCAAEWMRQPMREVAYTIAASTSRAASQSQVCHGSPTAIPRKSRIPAGISGGGNRDEHLTPERPVVAGGQEVEHPVHDAHQEVADDEHDRRVEAAVPVAERLRDARAR